MNSSISSCGHPVSRIDLRVIFADFVGQIRKLFIIKNMNAHNYKWLLVFFMLWLPLQGVAAAVLSVCVQEKNFIHQHDPLTITSDSHHHDACHKQTDDNTTGHWLASLPCDDTACDAYGNTPILPGYTAPVLANSITVVTSYDCGFVSFVPEQPQHPPLPAYL
jgi:hypothetical protein